jgi:hypothetical protein
MYFSAFLARIRILIILIANGYPIPCPHQVADPSRILEVKVSKQYIEYQLVLVFGLYLVLS